MWSKRRSQVDDPATQLRVAPAVAALRRTARWCRGGSFVERHMLNAAATQLRNIGGKTVFCEKAGDRRSQTADWVFGERGISQDVADLLFHAAAMPPRPALQAGLHLFFNVAYDQLSQASSP